MLYLNDVVMLLWVIDTLPADPGLRARWAATLNRFQYRRAAPTAIRRSRSKVGSTPP